MIDWEPIDGENLWHHSRVRIFDTETDIDQVFEFPEPTAVEEIHRFVAEWNNAVYGD